MAASAVSDTSKATRATASHRGLLVVRVAAARSFPACGAKIAIVTTPTANPPTSPSASLRHDKPGLVTTSGSVVPTAVLTHLDAGRAPQEFPIAPSHDRRGMTLPHERPPTTAHAPPAHRTQPEHPLQTGRHLRC